MLKEDPVSCFLLTFNILCTSGQKVKSIEEIARVVGRGPESSGVKVAYVYSYMLQSLRAPRQWSKRNVKNLQEKVRFYRETGYPNFPLGKILIEVFLYLT